MTDDIVILIVFVSFIFIVYLYIEIFVSPVTKREFKRAKNVIASRLTNPKLRLDELMQKLDPEAKPKARKLLEGIAEILEVQVDMLGYSGTLQELLVIPTPNGERAYFLEDIFELIQNHSTCLEWSTFNTTCSLPEDYDECLDSFIKLSLEQILVGLYGGTEGRSEGAVINRRKVENERVLR
jgi:hypothetical protein